VSCICCGHVDIEKIKQKEARAVTKCIDKDCAEKAKKDEKSIKLLLLGAGESGKSTLFKQMNAIYGKGYSTDERLTYKSIIEQNTLSAIKILINALDDVPDIIQKECRMDSDVRTLAKEVDDLPLDTIIEKDIAKKIEKIWNDPAIQTMYENRSHFQFPDSGKYFFDKIDEISDPEYIPTQQDILRSRVRTTGIVESTFEIEGRSFQMFDVGGQRNERKKWIHCFENVTCVIFVAAISEYDQVLYEDETMNRMEETLKLFNEICNARWFVETSLILFLNKRDLFEEKIKRVPLTKFFKDYKDDPHNFRKCSTFIKRKFETLNRSPGKEIYTHITCATDTDNITHVFKSVKDTLIKRSLREGGFM